MTPPIDTGLPSEIVPTGVRELALRLAALPPGAEGGLPAYVWDLDGLRTRARAIRDALPATIEVFYAVKANPDAGVLLALAAETGGTLDGVEVASGGELAHVRSVLGPVTDGLRRAGQDRI